MSGGAHRAGPRRRDSIMQTARTQVGIVGAGPAGLMLGHLLHLRGIDSVIVENRSSAHVVERVRAGVLEQGTVDLMVEAGVGGRLREEGMRHGGIYIAFDGNRHRIDLAGLTGGRGITIYGQNEVVKDLIGARLAAGRPLHFEADLVSVHDLAGPRPTIRFRHDGNQHELACDVIAGCDGFHGVCRAAIPDGHLQVYERDYPFGWLGVLASATPTSSELVYSNHDRGFALFSMRSPAVTRLYLQCAPDENADDWSDDRIWTELVARLSTGDGWAPAAGPILQKGVTGMRSFVAEPMRYGRLFLAGDAAHIVPPTGAKGLNLAMADVARLSDGIAELYSTGREHALDEYSDRGVRRTWYAQRFSWWMTSMLHRSESATAFERRRQLAELDYLVNSTAAKTSLAENYVGLPFD
jgi:p-hydroxybenzoate 3-monooxygenase